MTTSKAQLFTILGIAATLADMTSGSIWTPAIHWITIISWLLPLGGYRTYATGTNSGRGVALPHDNLNQTKRIGILGRFSC